MTCYFIIDTYIDEKTGRVMYDEYIREVKPIVKNLVENTLFVQKKLLHFIRNEHLSGLL